MSALPRHEELILLSHITGKSRTELIIEEPRLPDVQRRAFFDACARRHAGEPLQYILGEWEFYGLIFKTDKRALIPRPETELLVEAVVEKIKALTPRLWRILDICTGSGCIAVALVKVLDAAGISAEVVATDISIDALALAQENAALHGVAEKVRFVQTDLAEALLCEGSLCKEEVLLYRGTSCEREGLLYEGFDIVVSNPPYIPSAQLAGLQKEVRYYEPMLALDGGIEGMDAYLRLLPQAYRLLKPGGGLFLEIGPVEVGDAVKEAGFCDMQFHDDYAGLARIIIASRGFSSQE